MKRILIFGGSSSIGIAIFKELKPFYDSYATYYSNSKFKSNKRYIYYDVDQDPSTILENLKPKIIITALKGNFNSQVKFFEKLIVHCEKHETKLMFISSSNVFDSFINYPSSENDKTFSRSIFG